MIAYRISPDKLRTFGTEGKPFLSFDQFLNLVQHFRDDHYAAQHIQGFVEEVGRFYSIWTVTQESRYFRHIWFDQIDSDLSIEFQILPLTQSSNFLLDIALRGADGALYFTNRQKLAVDRLVGDRFVLASWKRIPGLRAFLEAQAAA
ncbi:hypothetical protein [Rhodobacter sp. TJ_12]|uniref:hypothetical protein n=1 Tax=Rhodobacter sp. TJ_12 TaxID=2029399 RepID=UPI001CBC90FE|nr:hypothetical protein [Rhodobacter sp. TJ_12]